jgi:acyl-CoA synthetase (AMP-forming)/AMP-acid ligase II
VRGPMLSYAVPNLHTHACMCFCFLAVLQQGELAVRGPMLFREYWGRAQATAEAFDEEGYFMTGDTVSLEGTPPYYRVSTCVNLINVVITDRCGAPDKGILCILQLHTACVLHSCHCQDI